MENSNMSLPTTYKAEVNIFEGASMLNISKEETDKLLAPFDEHLIEIRPDGIIFLPQVFWRQRLNTTFGVGQWALIVKGNHKDPDPTKDKLYIEGVLIVRGNYVATAVGEAELHSDNKNQSWASVWESAKSDCITRCCKDLGIASELWQPQFAAQWQNKYAVAVWCKMKDGKSKKLWRKKTAAPFWNEQGQPQEQEQQQSPPPVQPNQTTTRTTGPGKAPVQLTDEELQAIDQWMQKINECKTEEELKKVFNEGKGMINSTPELYRAKEAKKKLLQNQ
jgi:hypothetical protein